MATPSRPLQARPSLTETGNTRHDITLNSLYRHLPSALGFTFVASSGLALFFSGTRNQLALLIWWLAFQIIGICRYLAMQAWRRGARPEQREATDLAVFAIGVLVSGFAWCIFALVFFPSASGGERMVIAFLLATVAAGSVNVLSPIPWLARSFIGLLILPLVLCFLYWGGERDAIIALLGSALFAALTGFVGVLRENHSETLAISHERDHLRAELHRLRFRRPGLSGSPDESALLTRNQLRHSIQNSPDPKRRQIVLHLKLLRFDLIEVQSDALRDAILSTTAQRIAEHFPGASIAHWGEAEFGVAVSLPPDADATATSVAQDLRQKLRKPVAHEGGFIGFDITIGVTERSCAGMSAQELLHQASVALWIARQNESGGVLAYAGEMSDQINDRHLMRQLLHQALADGTLSVVFQPVIPAARQQPMKMETLLRWNHPQRGAISPCTFIPVAEESGLIVPLGGWVLRKACAEAVKWPADTIVCVNVSFYQILASDLCMEVEQAVAACGLPPNRLEIELTESVLARNVEHVKACLNALRQLGVRISIDDFGTGYSSLAYLRHLPIDTIKIDRSFIADTEPGGRKLLAGIVSIARSLGFRVVGEGVETDEQHQHLLSLDIDYLQGFFLSRPLPPSQALSWLKDHPASGK